MTDRGSVELVDFGDAARLERFGDRLVDRPHPGATGTRRYPEAWRDADLRFDRDGGWTGSSVADGAGSQPWFVSIDGLSMQLRPTDAGQVGLFPEHAEMLPWLRDRVKERIKDGAPPPAVLHLFAYTGLATLAMAHAGAAVVHVDSARPTVAWARRNAESSGLADHPVRWIVDDARDFTERESRRDRRYAGVVLDPPTYGHGPGGRAWRIETDLEPLLAGCRHLMEPSGSVLLTAHTPSLGPDDLGAILVRSMRLPHKAVEVGELGLTATDGRRLELGAFARADGPA
jgi:23S rRNA (cytosine1962-C5)-methyltransferase